MALLLIFSISRQNLVLPFPAIFGSENDISVTVIEGGHLVMIDLLLDEHSLLSLLDIYSSSY